jgi:chromosome segregation ATPase
LQARLNDQHAHYLHRAHVDEQSQSQHQHEKSVLQQQLAALQQQFFELHDHPAIAALQPSALAHASPSFTNIRAALNASLRDKIALDESAAALQQQRAEWQQQLIAAAADARASQLENQELKQALSQYRHAANASDARASSCEAALKFFGDQNRQQAAEVAALQHKIRALSSELSSANSRSAQLTQAASQLQAALEHERARNLAAECRCAQLELQCSQQKAELLTKMNSAKAAASARLSARVTAIMLSEVMQQQLSSIETS